MSDDSDERQESRPTIEWVFGAVSAFIVVGVVAFLAYEAALGDHRPPDLVATIEKTEQVANGTLVVVAVRNAGDEAAAEVAVQAVATGEDGTPKEIVFDYVAAHAVRRGAFFIANADIGKGDLQISIHGYVEP